MKTRKSILSAIVVLFVFAFQLFAQTTTVQQTSGGGGGGGTTTTPVIAPTTPAVSATQGAGELPPTLPITSQEVLISNAKRLVAKVAVYVNSRGFVYGAPGTVTSFEKEYVPSVSNQPDFSELLAVVGMTRFSFETRNPNDPIEVTVEFRDKNGRGLFRGSQSFKLVKNQNGGYTAPAEIKVRVWPNGDLPVEITGADWVEIALLNERGETTETRSLDRDRRTGDFLFPVWLAGQKNVLVTAFDNSDDGTTVKAVYSAQTGARQPILASSMRASAALDNVLIFPPDRTLVVVSPDLDPEGARMIRSGASPLIQVSLAKTSTFGFYAEMQSEIAKGFWIRRADVQVWSYFQIVGGNPTDVISGIGVFDIIIDWPTFGKRQQSFSNEGGGKG